MKKLNLLWAVLLLLTACGKDPFPTDKIVTHSRYQNGSTYIQLVYGDDAEQYFKVLAENTVETVQASEYYGIEPPIVMGSNREEIPSEITFNGKTYTVVGVGDYAFYSRDEMLSVEIPNTVQYVGKRAFDFCLELKTVKLPDSVTQIGDWAFRSCTALTLVEMGTGIAGVWFDAFDDCRSLTTMICHAVTPPEILYDVPCPDYLWNCPITEIKVPAESVDAYKAAPLWCNHADKIVAL